MSSLESSGFPPPPPAEPSNGHDPAHGEQLAAAPPVAPPQPFHEVQPLQPLEPTPVEPVQQVQPAVLQPSGEPVEPLQPLALEPLQPTMPPPLPLLGGAEPASGVTTQAPSPVPRPEEVANLGVPLGTLIFRAGLLTEEQLEDALQEGVRSGKRLGEVLLESGLIDERDLGRLLADQKGLRFVELSTLALDPAATSLLSAEKAHMFAALPVGFENGVPVVAVADPSNELVTENLRRALGSDPRLVVASRSDLHSTIDRVHGAAVEEPEPVAQATEPLPEPAAASAPQPEPPAVEPEPEVAPVVPAAEAAPLVAPAAVEAIPVEPVPVEPVAAEPPASVAPEVAPVPEPAPAPEAEPLSAAEPVLQPVEVAHIEPLAPEAPEAVAEPATVVPEPAPAPPAPAQQPEPEPQPEVVTFEPVVAAAPEQTYSRVEPQAQPQQEGETEHELPSAVSYDVSLRLADGERVPVGSFGDPQKAREYAREVVEHLSEATDGWPFFGGRFLRPDTIVSVDIVPVGESDRWLGSAVRSNWASRLNR